MPRKKFNARLKPQYKVITVCRPENIDGISLKFRDLHTIYFIMLDYTERYFRVVEEDHARCGTALDLEAPITPRARQLEDLIRIMFSAYLSNFSALTDYLRKDMANDTGKEWLNKEMRTQPVLAGFRRLRNIDVHDESLHTLIGMRFRVLEQATGLYSDIVTKETHIHEPLAHEGIGFFPWALSPLTEFKNHPGLVDTLTFESVVQLAHTGIETIASLVNAALEIGYLTGNSDPLQCAIAHKAAPEEPQH
jgi:hypothetical protein